MIIVYRYVLKPPKREEISTSWYLSDAKLGRVNGGLVPTSMVVW